MQVKELSIIQDKFFEEVKDHQQLNAQLSI